MAQKPIEPRWEELRVNRMPAAPPGTEAGKILNFYLPMWLLAGGCFVELIAAFFGRGSYLWKLEQAGARIGLAWALVAAGALIGAKVRKFPTGGTVGAIFKSAAIAAAVIAISDLAAPLLAKLPTVVLISGRPPILTVSLPFVADTALKLCVSYTLLGVQFDLDESDSKYCASVLFVLALAAHFLGAAI